MDKQRTVKCFLPLHPAMNITLVQSKLISEHLCGTGCTIKQKVKKNILLKSEAHDSVDKIPSGVFLLFPSYSGTCLPHN
jgi:hypothetical protein